jgi:hypothetical protein
MRKLILLLVLALLTATFAVAADAPPFKRGAKVYIGAMPDGFDTYLRAAFEKKKVPISVVDAKDKADFELRGQSDTQKASNAKKLIMLDWHSDEQATIAIANIATGEVVYSYAVFKKSSAHGKQSTAEACAKHIKEKLESKM